MTCVPQAKRRIGVFVPPLPKGVSLWAAGEAEICDSEHLRKEEEEGGGGRRNKAPSPTPEKRNHFSDAEGKSLNIKGGNRRSLFFLLPLSSSFRTPPKWPSRLWLPATEGRKEEGKGKERRRFDFSPRGERGTLSSLSPFLLRHPYPIFMTFLHRAAPNPRFHQTSFPIKNQKSIQILK